MFYYCFGQQNSWYRYTIQFLYFSVILCTRQCFIVVAVYTIRLSVILRIRQEGNNYKTL
jgi:hypothetical protein